jgi:hypothetical protein
MAIVLKVLHDYGVWFYSVAAIVALFLLRAAILARRDRRQATFSLEREAARNREYTIMIVALVVIALMGGIYALNSMVTPNIEIPYEPTPTPTLLFLPTVTATPAPPTATSTHVPTARPTLRPIQLGTPTATATTRAAPAACPHPGVTLFAPGNGAQVKGLVSIVGTAAMERFQFYKIELGAGDNPAQWNFLFSGSAQVQGGQLGVWDTGPVPAGVYALRLVVVDQTGNFPEPCKVVVNVVK